MNSRSYKDLLQGRKLNLKPLFFLKADRRR